MEQPRVSPNRMCHSFTTISLNSGSTGDSYSQQQFDIMTLFLTSLAELGFLIPSRRQFDVQSDDEESTSGAERGKSQLLEAPGLLRGVQDEVKNLREELYKKKGPTRDEGRCGRIGLAKHEPS